MMPTADLVPHRPPMLLLDSVLETGHEFIAASARVDPGAWYAGPGGEMPAWFGVELMAQTIAAYSGASRAAQGLPPLKGYLLGTRAFVSAVPAFPAGAEVASALLKTLEVR